MRDVLRILVCLSTAATLAGCGHSSVGTAVEVALIYTDGLGLDTADVTVGNQTESGRIAHRMLLLVSDDLDGVAMPIEVWARKAGVRSAYGTGMATPARGKTVTVAVDLTACTPACNGQVFDSCTGAPQTCTLGCSTAGDAHCVGLTPASGVDPRLADGLRGTTMIAQDTTIDTDTGTITGGYTRVAGTGVLDGVGYSQLPATGGGPAIAVFAFHDLVVSATATVRVTGARAVVLLVGGAATIAGTIDASGGLATRAAAGPGGGVGGTTATAIVSAHPMAVPLGLAAGSALSSSTRSDGTGSAVTGGAGGSNSGRYSGGTPVVLVWSNIVTRIPNG